MGCCEFESAPYFCAKALEGIGSCDGSGIEQLISPECAELIAIELKKTPKPWAEMPLR